MNALLSRAIVIVTVLVSSGCYRMTIRNGSRPTAPAPVIEDQWRSATAVDVFPVDTPVPLDTACPNSDWAKIEQSRSPVNWLVDVFLAGQAIYESTHVDLWCTPASGPPMSAPPPAPKPDQETPL
jgi:hypothetical protein